MTNPPRGFSSWEELYESDGIEKLPWYFSALDPDLASALDRHDVKPPARVLDEGTGPGTQAIELAKRGYTVTATDLAPAAIAYAKRKAAASGVSIAFAQDDVLATQLSGPFDAIVDRGCFHVLAPEDRAAYVKSTHRLLAPSGVLFLKTFSQLQPGTEGPNRFTHDQLRAVFAEGFDVVELNDTVYHGQRDPLPKALFGVFRRV